MIACRTMTYCINGGRGTDNRLDLNRIGEVIEQADTDLVALQGITAEALDRGLGDLPQLLGMAAYGLDSGSGLAFFSRYPLRSYRAYDLGEGGRCLQLDFDLYERRIHLFNLSLSPNPIHRRFQLAALQGEELLGSPRLPCPIVVHGDFALPLPGPRQLGLCGQFRRARVPHWRATWPAAFPLWGRDRIYLRGEIKEIVGHIPWTPVSRKASSHLPLILALQLVDTRLWLSAEKTLPQRVLATGTRAGVISRM